MCIMDFKLRTPDYTPVSADPTTADTLPQAQSVRAAWSWKERLAITAVLFVVLRWRGTVFETGGFAATPTEELVDYADVLFSSREEADKLPGALSIHERRDISSFGFDLGGSTCACQLQWDVKQYWQRVFYGPKYVAPHCITNFLGVMFFHRWQWVIIWNYVHEIMEELSMGTLGTWSETEKVTDVESRYDSVINDMLLTSVPFILVGHYLIYVADIPDPFAGTWHHDAQSYKRLGLGVFQYWVILHTHSISGDFGTDRLVFGKLECHVGLLVVLCLQIAILWIYDWTQNLATWEPRHTQSISVILFLLWFPFIFRMVDDQDEQIISIASFTLGGAAILFYQQAYRKFNAVVLTGMAVLLFGCLMLWWQFEHVLPPPDNMFYAHRKWCGIAARTGELTDSCVHVK